jgi:hypothetical protein
MESEAAIYQVDELMLARVKAVGRPLKWRK